jgi:peptidoglycan hydrolase-like protein with peptidoglycan-binding domain
MKRLQTELHTRGLYTGTIDGELGRGTRTAIMNFETSIGQNATGLPTVSLLRRFGEERVKPSYQFSNGQGLVGPDQNQKTEPAVTPPAPTPAPQPLRRPLPPSPRAAPFNPFGRN